VQALQHQAQIAPARREKKALETRKPIIINNMNVDIRGQMDECGCKGDRNAARSFTKLMFD